MGMYVCVGKMPTQHFARKPLTRIRYPALAARTLIDGQLRAKKQLHGPFHSTVLASNAVSLRAGDLEGGEGVHERNT